MFHPPAYWKKTEIDEAIRHVQEAIGSDIVRIRYDIDKDWSGEWGIFFRVVLTDDAARNRLRVLMTEVDKVLGLYLNFDQMQVFPYVNFRSVSEQAAIQEPTWA